MNLPIPIEATCIYNEDQAAIALNTKPRSLESWRQNGTGPEFIRLGGRMVRYKGSALLKYIDERTFRSTSEEAQRAA